jgi:hypothetical protein
MNDEIVVQYMKMNTKRATKQIKHELILIAPE